MLLPPPPPPAPPAKQLSQMCVTGTRTDVRECSACDFLYCALELASKKIRQEEQSRAYIYVQEIGVSHTIQSSTQAPAMLRDRTISKYLQLLRVASMYFLNNSHVATSMNYCTRLPSFTLLPLIIISKKNLNIVIRPVFACVLTTHMTGPVQ